MKKRRTMMMIRSRRWPQRRTSQKQLWASIGPTASQESTVTSKPTKVLIRLVPMSSPRWKALGALSECRPALLRTRRQAPSRIKTRRRMTQSRASHCKLAITLLLQICTTGVAILTRVAQRRFQRRVIRMEAAC